MKRLFLILLLRRASQLAVALAIIVTFTACVAVPVPTTTRTSAPPSVEKVDFSFIKPSLTTKAEVADQLRWCDSGIRNESAFVCRWCTSSSAWIYALAVGDVASAGKDRNWVPQNAVIYFDKQGIVQEWRVVPEREITRELQKVAERESNHLKLSLPLTLSLERHYFGDQSVKIELTKEFLWYSAGDNSFEIPRDWLKSFSVTEVTRDDPKWASDEIRFTIHFTQRTKLGYSATFSGKPAELMSLIRYHVESNRAK